MPTHLCVEFKFCFGVIVDAVAHFKEPVTERLLCLMPQASRIHRYYSISMGLANGLVLTKPTGLHDEKYTVMLFTVSLNWPTII